MGPSVASLDDLKLGQEFVDCLKNATLENDGLPGHVHELLRNPLQHTIDIDDPILRLSIKFYLGIKISPIGNYIGIKKTFDEFMGILGHPHMRLLSLYQVQRRIKQLSGIYPIRCDMCVKIGRWGTT
ncbi:hypothetical protein C8Q75DRAFT_758986 [Abortiporus biennis]|nr:hypothetical protein C8Q75DRAFT_758986 [Abortiporus biennis]